MVSPDFEFQLRKLSPLEDPAELCARYVLLHLNQRHPGQWLSSPRRPIQAHTRGFLEWMEQNRLQTNSGLSRRLIGLNSASELFQHFYLRGVRLDSHEGLVGWIEGRYPLILRQEVPPPREMLAIQCEGRRFVSLMSRLEDQFVAHGRHADACDFLLHDFEHAHKFFEDPARHRGQVEFFRRLQNSLPALGGWMSDERFAAEMDYLMSDMNSHPIHLLKYLKAVVLNAEIRRSGCSHPDLDPFWREFFSDWGFEGGGLMAALKINRPGLETPEDLILTNQFFLS